MHIQVSFPRTQYLNVADVNYQHNSRLVEANLEGMIVIL